TSYACTERTSSVRKRSSARLACNSWSRRARSTSGCATCRPAPPGPLYCAWPVPMVQIIISAALRSLFMRLLYLIVKTLVLLLALFAFHGTGVVEQYPGDRHIRSTEQLRHSARCRFGRKPAAQHNEYG